MLLHTPARVNSCVMLQVIENNGQSQGSFGSGLPHGSLEEEGLCRGQSCPSAPMCGTAPKGTHSHCILCADPKWEIVKWVQAEGRSTQSSLVMRFTRSPLNPTDVRGAQASCLLDSQTLLNFCPTDESPGNLSADSDVRDLGEGLKCCVSYRLPVCVASP